MSPTLLVPLAVGWLSGWVVNYLSDSLPHTHRLSRPVCQHCGQENTWKLFLTFQNCVQCGRPPRLRTFIVQLLMIVGSSYIWFKPHRIGFELGLILLTYFAVVFVIDLEHRLILHPTSIVGAMLGLGIGIWANGLLQTLKGGGAGFIIMLLLYYLGVLVSKVRARRLKAEGKQVDDEEALGAGDVILSTILGFILGWPLIWFGLLLGIILGGVIGILMVLFWFISGKYRQQAWTVFMPYGPFFILSTSFIMFLPNWIVAIVPK